MPNLKSVRGNGNKEIFRSIKTEKNSKWQSVRDSRIKIKKKKKNHLAVIIVENEVQKNSRLEISVVE